MNQQDKISGGVHQSLRHDSGHKHVTGDAVYIADLSEPPGTLNVYIASSTRAHATITKMDLSAVRTAPGVVCVVCAEDIPGLNDVSPIAGDDPMYATDLVEYYGQSLFAVAAATWDQARAAAALAIIDYQDKPAILTIDQAMAAKNFLMDPYVMKCGDADKAIIAAPHKLNGRFELGGQEHFYLECQAAFAIPGEDQDVTVYSSTQHPSEIQHKVAQVLGIPQNAVTVEVRRMGGGFGGKESQGNLLAASAALIASKTGRAVKVVYDRDDDMIITGKRHDFRIDYRVGFDDNGVISGIEFDQAVRCGMSWDLSQPISDRAMFHADNCYYLADATITSYRCKTNTQSNTAFRGFGGPQGMVAMERVIEDIAASLQMDALDVRRNNFYDHKDAANKARHLTPYGMEVEDCVIQDIVDELAASSDYLKRRAEIESWNAQSPVMKRGIALSPLKFGISFTKTFLNQAGALVHIYTDGSIHLNHGGTEMGQGLFTKIAQVVAEEFQVDVERVKITATNTSKVPNTSATAASSGADINGMAAQNAARKIKTRLIEFLARQYQAKAEDIVFLPGRVRVAGQEIAFEDVIMQAYFARVQLSATGFYATPKISWDADKAQGRPFYYFTYGACVSEVIVDTLSGENRILRTDILHDAGKSLNPALDVGQVEGAFVQGAGWLTMEELVWDGDGRLMTHAPSTYKIPACSDRPVDFRVALFARGENVEDTIYKSKAVGEPPLMHGISVLMALGFAVRSLGKPGQLANLDAPATPERLLLAMDHARGEAST
ncbi:MAG: xanthine dehydrogenase molybdopterin binding subunit [Rhodospirillales bacterium]|nr:xanthine dehydrogenase molybdopterin binding subunit [Rhodospirillales bacterium]